jgi:two-component system LytT family response regulator
MQRALIIDDEASARTDLRAALAAHPEIQIIGEAATVKTAKPLLARDDYEIVFLDIQIVGGTGFDLVPDVRPGARIIFVTAHNQYAVRAFEVNALDYLLKPVRTDRLASALARLGQPAREQESTTEFRPDDLVHLNSGQQARFARLADLCVIESQENYTLAHLVDNTRVLVRRSLKSWEETLPGSVFFRVHRTMIVNLTRVTGFRRDGPKSVLLTVTGASEAVPVSRQLWNELKDRLPQVLD